VVPACFEVLQVLVKRAGLFAFNKPDAASTCNTVAVHPLCLCRSMIVVQVLVE
jgi:hypothetical protein